MDMKMPFVRKPNPALKAAETWREESLKDDPKDLYFYVGRRLVNSVDRIEDYRKKVVENSMMISQFLEWSGFDRQEADDCVDRLAEDLKYYSQDRWPQLCGLDFVRALSAHEVICMSSADLLIAGRILGPLLRFGLDFVVRVKPDSSSRLPWHYLATLLPIDENPVDSRLPEEPERTTLVVILDSADLFSAVKGVVQSTWQCNGQTHWAPTHVFVQEAVYEHFVGLLKFEAVNHVSMMGIESMVKKPVTGRLETLQPSALEHFRFFLGWNPKLFDQDELSGVTVLPFRTVDEAVTMANSLPECYCASVWSEKSNEAETTASRLKMNTVWVNCHGVLEPGSSFAPDSVSVPQNGPELFEACWIRVTSTPKFDVPLLVDFEPSTDHQPIKVTSLNEALSAVILPPSLTYDQRITLLKPLHLLIRSVDKSFSGYWHSEEDYRVAGKMKIKSKLLPASPVIVQLLPKHFSKDDYLSIIAIVHYIVAKDGRAVLVADGPSTFITQLATQFGLVGLLSAGYVALASPYPADYPTNNNRIVLGRGGRFCNRLHNTVGFPPGTHSLLPFLGRLFSRTKTVYIL